MIIWKSWRAQKRMASSVTIGGAGDIRRAASAFAVIVDDIGMYRPIVSHDIASRQPMIDENGEVLAAAVFGFAEPSERRWRVKHLALQSLLAHACRYESAPFWANADGFHPGRQISTLRR